MGYRGKLREREQARDLRAEGLSMPEIAERLGVSKSSVSLWTRDVPFETRPRARARHREPNALMRRKQAEIDRLMTEGRERVGELSEREFLMAGIALYAGEGGKRDGEVKLTNTPIRESSVSSASGCAISSSWTNRAFERASTFTRASTSTLPPPIGRR